VIHGRPIVRRVDVSAHDALAEWAGQADAFAAMGLAAAVTWPA
jgi:hypothetical protein